MFFEVRDMESVLMALASADTFHSFLARECQQATIETGDDYFCDLRELVHFQLPRQRQKRCALIFRPYKIRMPHDNALEQMSKYIYMEPAHFPGHKLPMLPGLMDSAGETLPRHQTICAVDEKNVFEKCSEFF